MNEKYSSTNWLKEYFDPANAEHNTYVTIPTGFTELDEATNGGIQEGITFLISGTGKGKTFFTTQVILNAMETEPDLDVLLFSLEMSRKKIADRLVAQVAYKLDKESQVNPDDVQKYLNGKLEDKEKIKALEQAISELTEKYSPRLEILDRFTDNQVYDFKKHDIEEIKKIIEEQVEAHPDRKHLVAIDYFHLITKSNSFYDERRQLNEIMDELAKLAIKYHIVFFIVVIENRKSTDKNAKDFLGDIDHLNLIKGSGELEHYAYQAILLKDDAISLIKSRDGETRLDMKVSHIRPTGSFISRDNSSPSKLNENGSKKINKKFPTQEPQN